MVQFEIIDQKEPVISRLHSAIITLGLPQGHNDTQNKRISTKWRVKPNMSAKVKPEETEKDGLLDLGKPDEYARMEVRGKDTKLYELHLCIPFFIIATIIAQVSIHIYFYTGERCDPCNVNRFNSKMQNWHLMLRPKRQIGTDYWEFLTYQFLHAGWEHLLGNILLLIVIGIPMETIHGPFRIGTVYSVGVIVGGVMAIIVTPYSSLIGSSGGCYALMFAFVADIVMNFDIMTTFGKVLRIAPMGVFVVMDFGLFIRREFFAANKTSISWAAHLGGALVGLSLGICVLKNFRVQRFEKYLQIVSLISFGMLLFGMALTLFVQENNRYG